MIISSHILKLLARLYFSLKMLSYHCYIVVIAIVVILSFSVFLYLDYSINK